MKAFKDKTAIVTGGASGIGRELCMQLAGAGAKVYVADINKLGADKTVSAIAGNGGKAESIMVDMRNSDAVEKMINAAASKGTLNFMFNNASMIMFGEFRDMNYGSVAPVH